MAEAATENKVNLGWDPGRVLFGLSRIGYTPASAVCDLIDNSVRAEADHVHVLIRKEREDLNDRRRNNVRSYVIIDDGHGMDANGLADALKLGSPQEEYEEGALAKFGLGLKAAALSQGERLELISAPEEDPGSFQKRVLSLPAVQETGRYFASEEALTGDDRTLIDDYLPEGHGTIVRVAEVRRENHPSVRSTVDELTYKAGVIYYYFLREGLHVEIGDEEIEPFDVLFTGEAEENSNLNEHEWGGKTVQWIQKPKSVLLDADADVEATIEVTQLPYPRIFELEERGGRKRIGDKYRLEASNYGFYVYRNKRLISWAERFGLIPQHGNYYGFRGRLLIDDSADDAFNIDVKKASITLSDDAERTLGDYTDEYRRKSDRAWSKASSLFNELKDEDTSLRSNQMAEDLAPEELPGEGFPSEEEVEEQNERDADLRREMRERLRREAAARKREEEGREVDEDELTEEDLNEALREDANPAAHKIFRVSRIEDNALWEPYYDADHGTSVRINKYHRFGRLIYEDNAENADLQVLFDLMMLQFAQSEVEARTKLTRHEREEIRDITAAYRRFVSGFLAGMCRTLDGELPQSGV